MGYVSNFNDLERFMRSEEGRQELEEVRKQLVGQTISRVTFTNEADYVQTLLHLSDGETFALFQPCFDVDAIRERHGQMLMEEYHKDTGEKEPQMNTDKHG